VSELVNDLTLAISELNQIQQKLTWIKAQIADDPKMTIFWELVTACGLIERQYHELIVDIANDECDPRDPKELYKKGVNIEFQIEASDWHKISKVLRKTNHITWRKQT